MKFCYDLVGEVIEKWDEGFRRYYVQTSVRIEDDMVLKYREKYQRICKDTVCGKYRILNHKMECLRKVWRLRIIKSCPSRIGLKGIKKDDIDLKDNLYQISIYKVVDGDIVSMLFLSYDEYYLLKVGINEKILKDKVVIWYKHKRKQSKWQNEHYFASFEHYRFAVTLLEKRTIQLLQ